MNPVGRSTLRRANPLFMLVIGGLIGSLVTGIGREPGGRSESVASTAGGNALETTLTTLAAGTGAAAGDATTTTLAAGAGAAPVAGAAPAAGAGATSPAAGAKAAPATTGGCAGTASTTTQGVTAKSVKIGFAIPDISALGAVFGEQVDPKDMPGHIRAVLAGMRKDGRLPICGRDIEAVFRTYNVLDPAASRSVCVGFADQDKVFAVIALFSFGAASCVTVEKKTVLLDLGSLLADADYAQSPLLFGTDPSIDRAYRSLANWILKTNLANGKTIGLYYNSAGRDLVKKNIIDVLAAGGHPVNVEVSTDAAATSTAADPNDSVAIQRFRAGGVDLAIPLSGSSNFYRQAQLQAYKAQWAVEGVALASDATTKQYEPNTFDGALGLLFDHVGEESSGIPLTKEADTCYRYWREAGGTVPPRDYGEGQVIRESCDQINLVTKAMGVAGNNLTTTTLVLGMETIKDFPLSYYSDQTFVRGKHWGSVKNVIEQYHKDCTCWKVTGPFQPLYGL
jgi:hypothetical protein